MREEKGEALELTFCFFGSAVLSVLAAGAEGVAAAAGVGAGEADEVAGLADPLTFEAVAVAAAAAALREGGM